MEIDTICRHFKICYMWTEWKFVYESKSIHKSFQEVGALDDISMKLLLNVET